MIRVIAYARQSLARAGEQADTSLSLDAQVAAIEAHAARNQWTIIETIRDHDLRGDDWARPGLQDAISKASRADVLAVFALSRLARDNVLQETIYRQIRAAGCQLVSITEPAAADTLTRQILGAVAQADKERMGRFLSAAFRQKQQRGEHHGAAPYGYRRESGGLVIDHDEADVVRAIVARINDGWSMRAILRQLQADGPPPRHAPGWTDQTIRKIVTNPVHAGRIVTPVGEVAGTHEPTCDPAAWASAVARFRSRPHLREKPVTSWMEGYVVHACGCRMYLVLSGRSRLFRCRLARDARCAHDTPEVSATRVEWAARQLFGMDLDAAVTLSEARHAHETAHRAHDTSAARDALLRRLSDAQSRHANARDRWFAGAWSDAMMDEADARLAAVESETRHSIAALPVEPDWTAMAAFLDAIPDLRSAVRDASAETLRDVLGQLAVLVVDARGWHLRYQQDIARVIPSPATVIPPKRTI